MLILPKKGDKVYCIKDVYNSYIELLMSKNTEYIIRETYTDITSYLMTIEIFNVNNENYYIFFIDLSSSKKYTDIYNYYDFFSDMKGYRKIKLLNIIK